MVGAFLRGEDMEELNIVWMQCDDLIPYEKNPRKNDKAVKYVAKSIEKFGWKQPLVIDKDNVVVCGHTRLKAAKKLGLDKCPCIIAEDLTEEQIKAFRLADNKVAEHAEWDWDLLDGEINDIPEIDMGDFGFVFEEADDATPYDGEDKPKKNERMRTD